MNKLRLSIIKQNKSIDDLSERLDYYTIINPIYNAEHINIIAKTKEQEYTKNIVEHFYSPDYLINLLEGNYQEIKRSIMLIMVILTMVVVILCTVLVITFSYLENKSLSLIPLFTLIILTIVVMFLIINYMRLQVIGGVINNPEYEIDKKYVFLSIYKMKKEEQEDKPIFGLAEECMRLKDECS